MSKQWHSGPPPSYGWWPASLVRNTGVYRWRDPEGWWSGPVVGKHRPPEWAAAAAKSPAKEQDRIEWQDRPDDWPARSRT